MQPFLNPDVAAKFAGYLPAVRRKMLALRELVFRTAAATPRAGPLEESLKWGEPAYLTANGAGSTVRMDWKPKSPDEYALYFNCNTTLMQTFRTLFPKELRFEGNRAVVLGIKEVLPKEALALCVGAALTYHVKQPQSRQPAAKRRDA